MVPHYVYSKKNNNLKEVGEEEEVGNYWSEFTLPQKRMMFLHVSKLVEQILTSDLMSIL